MKKAAYIFAILIALCGVSLLFFPLVTPVIKGAFEGFRLTLGIVFSTKGQLIADALTTGGEIQLTPINLWRLFNVAYHEGLLSRLHWPQYALGNLVLLSPFITLLLTLFKRPFLAICSTLLTGAGIYFALDMVQNRLKDYSALIINDATYVTPVTTLLIAYVGLMLIALLALWVEKWQNKRRKKANF